MALKLSLRTTLSAVEFKLLYYLPGRKDLRYSVRASPRFIVSYGCSAPHTTYDHHRPPLHREFTVPNETLPLTCQFDVASGLKLKF